MKTGLLRFELVDAKWRGVVAAVAVDRDLELELEAVSTLSFLSLQLND